MYSKLKSKFSKIGLFLNLFGTILIAFSIEKGPLPVGQQTKGSSKMIVTYFSIFHEEFFYFGLLLIFFGFLFQLLQEFQNQN